MPDPTQTHIPTRDPRSGAVVGEIAVTPPSDVAEGVARARAAQVAWAARSLDERIDVVRSLGDAVLARAGDLVQALVDEIGKPAGEAWTSELVTAQELFAYWLDAIEDELAPAAVPLNPVNYPGKDVEVRWEPVGVVAMIMPWNYPVHLPLRTIVPALLVGDAVVWKPSELAARCGAVLDEIFRATLPKDLVITVQGAREQGEALIDAGPDHVVFVGSTATGRAVATRAAARLVPVSCELGSKDPAIVLEDANLDRTAAGLAWGAFHNAGQDCASVERIYVHEDVHDAFVEKLVAAAAALRPGKDLGPLISEAQLAKVKAHVDDAVARGAVVRAGGAPSGEGYFFPATVLTGVTDDMLVMREETFGPIAPVAAIRDEAEAVTRANALPYALCASVWSKDIRRAQDLVARVRCGTAYVNNHAFTGPMGGAAWSGRGESGWGVTGSKHMLGALTRPRTVCVDRAWGSREMWWYPYSENLVTMARGLVELTRGGGARISGARMAVTGLLGRWK